ncbi:MAG TPA: DUF222 domain-containing protein [Mycobacteriales bacterium]|jgi:hypothetical protein|nr:DUF222 domain-containing protein [Mycobacteriales bacterium]
MFETVALAEPEEPAGDWTFTPDWPVLMAEGLGPTGEALNVLSGCDPAGLSEAARTSALSQLAGIDAHLGAVRARFTNAVAGPKRDEPHEDWGAHEVAVSSRCSVYAADRQIEFARALAGRLSKTFDAMEAGRINYPQALALFEAVAPLEDEVAWQIEENMLRYAWRQDLTKFKICLRRWVAREDPNFSERSKEARKDIAVVHTPLDDGTGELYIRGPLEQTTAIDLALTAYAKTAKPTLGGTAEGRKLAGLVQWAENYLTAPDAPRRHGRASTVTMTIDAPTMLGLTKHPAEIPGVGMIPGDAVLEVLAEGSPIRRLIIDEHDGHLLDYGTKTYVVPPPLADHLIALHQSAAAPHSNVPAAVADMDHNQPHDQKGKTSPENVTPLDRRWHRAKTHAGWTYVKNQDGTVDWTSPTGQTHRVDPHDYRLGP